MRKAKVLKKRLILPDPKYHNQLVSQLVNYIMRNGKKETARKIAYEALERSSKTLDKEPLEVLDGAVVRAGPMVEVRSKRIGGATYQVPREVMPHRKTALALRWIVNSARASQGKPMAQFLAQELVNAYKGEGVAVRKKEEVHKIAEANKAFAHYARF